MSLCYPECQYDTHTPRERTQVRGNSHMHCVNKKNLLVSIFSHRRKSWNRFRIYYKIQACSWTCVIEHHFYIEVRPPQSNYGYLWIVRIGDIFIYHVLLSLLDLVELILGWVVKLNEMISDSNTGLASRNTCVTRDINK